MKRFLSLCFLLLLTGCQYVTFLKTNTTTAPSEFQNSPEVACEALGAEPGNATMDWCVRREELARGRNDFGF